MSHDMSSNRTAVVVGAGIVGVSCALQLQRRGVQVTLLDREDPGTQCSYGNAGRIATGLCAPYSLPGLIWKVPGMLRDRRHPFKSSLSHLARSLPWFVRYLRCAARAEEIADALHALLSRVDAAFDDLLEPAEHRALIRGEGVLYVYKTCSGAESSRAQIDFARTRGVRVEHLTGDEIRELEPELPPDISQGYYWPRERFVADPLGLTRALLERFVGGGGQLLRDEAMAVEPRHGAPHRVRTTDGDTYDADAVVVAAGAWSSRLAAQVGVSLPMQAERGYHVQLPAPGVSLTRPVHYGDRLVSFTPMRAGLRILSGAEFAPPDAAANWDRAQVLLDCARELFPDIDPSAHQRWMGPRPALPDSMPAIGPGALHRDIFFACGHGHLGLTLSALTGQLIAELATTGASSVDLYPYRPDRF